MVEFKFKIGDKVRVCEDKVKFNEYYPNDIYFDVSMIEFFKGVYTIRSRDYKTRSGTKYYKLFEDDVYIFDEAWLELTTERSMNSKFKVGDKVKVHIDSDHQGKYLYHPVDSMIEKEGQIVTISDVRKDLDVVPEGSIDDGYVYEVSEDSHKFNWSSGMFELVSSSSSSVISINTDIRELTVNDKITIKNGKIYSSSFSNYQSFKIVKVDTFDSDQKYKCVGIDTTNTDTYWIHMYDILHVSVDLVELFKVNGPFTILSKYLGKIEITALSDDPDYPVLCKLEDGDQIMLTKEGKFFNNPDLLPIL